MALCQRSFYRFHVLLGTFHTDIARDGKGVFHYKGSGDEVLLENVGRVDYLAHVFADYGEEILHDLRATVAPLKGFEAVARIIDFRLKNTQELVVSAGR